MKKFIMIALVLGLALVSVSVNAQEKYVGGGFEASGHIVTGLGFQARNNKTQTEFMNDGDITSIAGPLGRYLENSVDQGDTVLGTAYNPTKKKNFEFFVDEVELDLMKSFGENIRLRADLDFGRVASGSATNANGFILEQAYATANIPLGNGVEFLLGRFNTPMGFEAVDVADNDLISKTALGRGLRPVNNTGAKIYYAFSDLVDLHFYVVNSLYNDNVANIKNMPSVGARLGFNWGDEGTESTFGISPFFGPESRIANKYYTFGVDADLNWWLTESFALGAEVLYSYNQQNKSALVLTGTKVQYMAGLLNLHYVFSDVWDGTLRYSYTKQFKPATGTAILGTTPVSFNDMDLTGTQQQIHEIALGGGYAVADGAKFKLEGRMDIVIPNVSGTTQYTYGAVAGFVYDF